MAAVGLAKRRLHPVHTRLRTKTAREEKKGLLGGGGRTERLERYLRHAQGRRVRRRGHKVTSTADGLKHTDRRDQRQGDGGGGRRRSRRARTTHQRLNAERLHLWMGSHVAARPLSASSLQGDKQPDCEGAAQNIRQPLPRHPSMFSTACRNGGGHFPGNIQQEPAWKEPTMWTIWLSREAPLEMPTWLRCSWDGPFSPHMLHRETQPPQSAGGQPHTDESRDSKSRDIKARRQWRLKRFPSTSCGSSS